MKTKASKFSQVQKRVNRLTDDEDERQDLLLSYLSGLSPDTFSVKLTNIRVKSKEKQLLEVAAYQLMNTPAGEDLIDQMRRFSDLEKDIILYLTLGFTPQTISRYKGIGCVRVKQVISVIRSNPSWEKYLDGIKKKI